MAAPNNVEFLKDCARLIPTINFADYETGEIYARLEKGAWSWCDRDGLERALNDEEARAGLEAVGSNDLAVCASGEPGPPPLDIAHAHTLGRWGALRARTAAAG